MYLLNGLAIYFGDHLLVSFIEYIMASKHLLFGAVGDRAVHGP